jgi:glutamyl-tRNA reductase
MTLAKDCKITTGIKDAKLTIIGAGKMARLLLVHLETQGVNSITVVNRSPDRVIELQKEFPGISIEYRPMTEMWEVCLIDKYYLYCF